MAEKQSDKPSRRTALTRTPKVDSEEEKTALNVRFKQAVQKIGGNAAFLRGFKMPESTLGTWLSGQSLPSIQALIFLSNQHGFSPDWLLRGVEPMMTADALMEHDRKIDARAGDSTAVSVKFYEFLRPAAGSGREVLEETARVVFFDDTWLRRTFGIEARDCILITSVGDSMEPLIHTADPLLIDVSERGKQFSEGVFFIRHEGVIKLKRLSPRPGKQLRISSDNPAYDPYDVSLDDESLDLLVIGRVISIIRRL